VDNNRLYFDYDKMGDILYISKVKSYSDQESDEIEDGIIARFNPKNNEIESIEILSFSKRLENDKSFSIPIMAKLIKFA
jgi:uncharacterized protein YuzE